MVVSVAVAGSRPRWRGRGRGGGGGGVAAEPVVEQCHSIAAAVCRFREIGATVNVPGVHHVCM